MSLFNEILLGRIQQLPTRLFNMVGGSPLPQVAPEVGFDYHLDAVDNELALLQGIGWASVSQYVAPVAGQYSRVAIINPSDSGVIVTISDISFMQASANVLRMVRAYTTVLGYGAISGLNHDMRRLPAVAPVGGQQGTSATNYTGDGSLCDQFIAPANVWTNVKGPWVLTPGTLYSIVAAVVNEFLFVRYHFSWRAGTPAELAATL